MEFKNLLFINATDQEDPEVEILRNELIDKAFEHPRWGEEMPTAWVPLELQLAEKVEKGVNIISKDELSTMNKKNELMVLTNKQLETFLKLQHSLGKLLYFDEVNLRKYIIINPVFLVDVLRSLVTEKQFWPKGMAYENIHDSLHQTGTIKTDDILLLWNRENFTTFLSHKDYLLDILVHLDVLVIPQNEVAGDSGDNPEQNTLDSNGTSSPGVPFYFIPCMVQKPDDTNYLKKKCLPHTSIIMSFRFVGEIIPPALAYRYMASLINMWNIRTYEGRKMMFSNLLVVQVDDKHDIAVQVKGKRIIVSLIHVSNVVNIIPSLASSVQECLTAAVHRISEFYTVLSDSDGNGNNSMPFEIDFGVICKSFFRKTICFFPHIDIPSIGDLTWSCKHGTSHDVRHLSLWFADKVLSFCMNI